MALLSDLEQDALAALETVSAEQKALLVSGQAYAATSYDDRRTQGTVVFWVDTFRAPAELWTPRVGRDTWVVNCASGDADTASAMEAVYDPDTVFDVNAKPIKLGTYHARWQEIIDADTASAEVDPI